MRLEQKGWLSFFNIGKFQFHKGAIRTLFYIINVKTINYFNSIKVRLERASRKVIWSPLLFQFHKGAIRTVIAIFYEFLSIEFQFHKGAIRTMWISPERGVMIGFQFHKGAIRTTQNLKRVVASSSYFNSIKVRLEL